MPKLYIIDGNAYIHRAYHALPQLFTSKGEMVNAVYGFIRMLLKIIKQEKPEYLAVCFDSPSPTFRHKEYPEYKANRKKIDDELKNQFPLVYEAVKILNIVSIAKPGYEADDLIASLAKNAEKDNVEVIVVTGDKDALQLVNKNIKVWNEIKNILYDEDAVKNKYGVYPSKLIDMFALMGDSSDNVPGIKGIGEKTALKLIQKFDSLENVLSNYSSLEGKLKNLVENGKKDALQSKYLVTLCDTAPLDISWHECRINRPSETEIIDFIKKMEFNSLLKEFSDAAIVKSSKEDIVKNIIFEIEDLHKLISEINSVKKVSIDLETNSANPINAKIVGISMAVNSHASYYIPVAHNYLNVPKQLLIGDVLKYLKPLLEDENIKKYGQNLKYEILVFENYGIFLKGIYFDSMVASYCLNPSKISHNLKTIVLDYVGYKMIEIEELIGKGVNQITMDKVDIVRAAEYACTDSVAVLWLAGYIEPQLEEKNLKNLFYNFEMPLINVLARMERFGIKADTHYAEQLSNEFQNEILNLEKEIYSMAGQKFNPNSPKQLSVILFEKLNLPIVKKTKTGYSTNEEVLKTLALQHPLPEKIINYREIQKLKSTYIDSVLRLTFSDTQRIHTSFNQTVTATGRLSSSEPNMQNIPIKSEYGKKIRRSFVAEKGYIFVSADYSQIDLRSLAHISEDDTLIQAFKADEDIHTATARDIFNKSAEEEIDSNLRRIAKTINFGIIYGMSAFSLAQQLGLSNAQAKQYIENYFNKYKGVKKWIDSIIKETKEKGYVTTLLGRVRYLPDINSSNAQVRGFAERMAMNTPIQGTSADIIKAAMININNMLSGINYSSRMLLQVHDDLLFEVPEKDIEFMVKSIKELMENAVTLKVPLKVEVKAGYNWADMRAK